MPIFKTLRDSRENVLSWNCYSIQSGDKLKQSDDNSLVIIRILISRIESASFNIVGLSMVIL